MVDPSLIDPHAIENLRDLNPGDNDEFLRELLVFFSMIHRNGSPKLDQALSAGDESKFVRAAHTSRGAPRTSALSALRAAAEKLETLSRTEGLGQVAALVAEVKHEFNRARTELDKLMGK